MQPIARGLALAPAAAAGAGEEGGLAGRDRLVEGGAIHIRQGQDLQGGGVLDDDGDEAAGLVEVEEEGSITVSFPVRRSRETP